MGVVRRTPTSRGFGASKHVTTTADVSTSSTVAARGPPSRPKATGGSSPAPRRRSVDSSSLRRDERRRDGCARSDGVRDAVLVVIESSCPSSDRDRTVAPRPRVRCSFVSLVAGAGVAALRTHCRCCPVLWVTRLPFAVACAARFVKGGSCAQVLVISLPLVPCLPPQLAFCYDRVCAQDSEPI